MGEWLRGLWDGLGSADQMALPTPRSVRIASFHKRAARPTKTPVKAPYSALMPTATGV